jgi:hypothetical protein
VKDQITKFLLNHRKSIGYGIGTANVISGLLNILVGNVIGGVFWIGIGAMIIFDIRSFDKAA